MPTQSPTRPAIALPSMYRVRQRFDAPRIENAEDAARAELAKLGLGESIRPGQTVAITAGSRGIRNIDRILRAIVGALKALEARPFIVPAMGSHGGGTAEGQVKMLQTLGITEESMGCEIRSSMEVVEIARSDFGMPIYFDKIASEADHVALVNRVKSHTIFTGDIESGLMKMMLIGLGKHRGATLYHRASIQHSFDQIVRSVGQAVVEKMPIAFGLAIVENGNDETALLEAIRPRDIKSSERRLLKQAKAWAPRIPFDDVDALILDEMGKNISGAGMDCNVIGRKGNPRVALEGETPRIGQIFVRDLTPESKGNAVGIGRAEFATQRLVDKIDRHATYTNCITAVTGPAAAIPIHFETDREVLDVVLTSLGLKEPQDARLVWAKNTLELRELEISAALLPEARQQKSLEVVSGPQILHYGSDGNLPLIGRFRR